MRGIPVNEQTPQARKEGGSWALHLAAQVQEVIGFHLPGQGKTTDTEWDQRPASLTSPHPGQLGLVQGSGKQRG